MSDGSLSREFEARICAASAVVLLTMSERGIEAEIMHNQDRGEPTRGEPAGAWETAVALAARHLIGDLSAVT